MKWGCPLPITSLGVRECPGICSVELTANCVTCVLKSGILYKKWGISTPCTAVNYACRINHLDFVGYVRSDLDSVILLLL